MAIIWQYSWFTISNLAW